MIYTITNNNLHIRQSYQYKIKDMQSRLENIKSLFPKSNVWKRSLYSLKAEWIVHNACYRLHIFRSHTADIDLNQPNRLFWLYVLLSPIARLIVK